MRRDVYIENDSGGFSVLTAAAVDRIIDDERSDDMQFVTGHEAMLLMLRGDDSMPVRVVVDEPLTADEESQWLARASWRLDSPDGRFLVMGGFDPDVLTCWRDDHGPDGDGRGVAVVQAEPGSWRVDIYAHVGSMNGRAIVEEADEQKGAFFRRSHPGKPFPLWLASRLEHSGDEDPGHEDAWKDVVASFESSRLAIATEPASVVGFLVHFTRFEGSLPAPPADGWFAENDGKRLPGTMPLGLAAGVPDPELEHFLDKLLRRSKPVPELPIATSIVEIIGTWPGDTLERLEGGGDVPLAPADAFHLHWMAALGSDSPPRFELLVSEAPGWSPPEPMAEFGVAARGRDAWALGPPLNSGGWFTWRAAQAASAAIASVPDGACIDLAMLRDDAHGDDDDVNPAVGRALYSGKVAGGTWRIAEASPKVARDVLVDALAFVRSLVETEAIPVRGDAERAALVTAAEMASPEEGSLVHEGDAVRLAEPDWRTLMMLAGPVFRTRFGEHWAVDPIEEEW